MSAVVNSSKEDKLYIHNRVWGREFTGCKRGGNIVGLENEVRSMMVRN